MQEQFIPYEQSLALKELGFDEECLAYYNGIGELIFMAPYECLSAPLWQQAFYWFREKHKILAVIDSPCDGIGYFYGFNRIETPLIRGHNFIQGSDKTYITYEETQLACLKKLIEIVKEQK